jgi:hypothetical protein
MNPASLSSGPHCQRPLQFNPFFAAADDYAEVLRRGLESSRRQKGETDEETLAHLLAFSVHLENTGKPDEARQLLEQYNRFNPKTEDRR